MVKISRLAHPATGLPAAVSALVALTTLGACTHQPSEFSWSHSESGEYLFAFDTRECGTLAGSGMVPADTRSESALGSPEFFNCMQGRGYFLVDPATGRPLAAGTTAGSRILAAPQAGR